jgi:CheY-like chemotaxis protein
MAEEGTARVLVVGHDSEVRDRIGRWLEDDGLEVIGCPGPTRPDYTCVGSRTQRCPLAQAADVVILDLVLASDVMMEGTPAEALLIYYTWAAKKVVALNHGGEQLHGDDDVIFRPWPPERESLLEAVRQFTKPNTPCVVRADPVDFEEMD